MSRYSTMLPIMGPIDEQIIGDLRRLYAEGSKPTHLLHFLHDSGINGLSRLFYFMVAFDLNMLEVTIIIGWRPDGTSNPDEAAIDELLCEDINDVANASYTNRNVPSC